MTPEQEQAEIRRLAAENRDLRAKLRRDLTEAGRIKATRIYGVEGRDENEI